MGDYADALGGPVFGNPVVTEDVHLLWSMLPLGCPSMEVQENFGRHQPEAGARGIVARKLAWTPQWGSCGRVLFVQSSHNRPERRRVNGARTQNAWRVRSADIQDCGLDSDCARASVDDETDPVTQPGLDMSGGGGGELICGVGAGGSQGETGAPNDRLYQGVARPANPHGWASGSHDVRNVISAWNHQGQRSRPEGIRKLFRRFRPSAGARACLGTIRHVNDNGIVERALLHFINASNRARVQRVSGQSVDGLGWQDDDLSTLQGADGGVDRGLEAGGRIDGQNVRSWSHRGRKRCLPVEGRASQITSDDACCSRDRELRARDETPLPSASR